MLLVPSGDSMIISKAVEPATTSDSGSFHTAQSSTSTPPPPAHFTALMHGDYKLHPQKPDTISAGTLSSDGSKIWIKVVPMGRNAYMPYFLDQNGKIISEPPNLIWHEGFEYTNFPMTMLDPGRQKRMQRRYIYEKIKELQALNPEAPRAATSKATASKISDPISSERMSAFPMFADVNSTSTLSPITSAHPGTTLRKRRRSSGAQRLAIASDNPTLSSADDVSIVQIKRRKGKVQAEAATANKDNSQQKAGVNRKSLVASDKRRSSRGTFLRNSGKDAKDYQVDGGKLALLPFVAINTPTDSDWPMDLS